MKTKPVARSDMNWIEREKGKAYCKSFAFVYVKGGGIKGEDGHLKKKQAFTPWKKAIYNLRSLFR